MKHIIFEYRDEYCKDGKFHEQECFVESVEQMVKFYGLDKGDVEWNILDVEEVKKMKINGVEIAVKEFAFDGCHKFYLIEKSAEKNEAEDLGYCVYPIDKLPQMFGKSCPLRFIEKWDFTTIVPQFKEKVRFQWNGGAITYSAKED